MINIARRIQSLYSGQTAIVVAVIGAVAGGLLSLRHTDNRKRRAAEVSLVRIQADMDSLSAQAGWCTNETAQLADSLTRVLNRAMIEGRLPYSGRIEPTRDCSAIPTRTSTLTWLKAALTGTRDRLGIQVVALEMLALLFVSVALSILWVWFEGRR